WSLTGVLRGVDGAGDLGRVDVVQPVLWAVMVSLAAVWAEYGVRPAAVVGHSQGEIAAACVAGALTLEDGARVVALRSRALRRLAGGGAMASLALGCERVEELLSGLGDRVAAVVVAAVNGPVSTVVSGPPEQVAAMVAACGEVGERARMIEVDYASHSPQVDEIAGELCEVLRGVEPVGVSGSGVVFYSTVTGGRADTSVLDSDYWVRNLRERVRFAEAIEALLGAGHRVFIEASTHPVLTMGMRETFEHAESDAAAVPTLRRDHGDLDQLTRSVAQAFLAGAGVDWRAAFPADPPPQTVDLPTYAFQRRRYWLDAPGGPGGDPAALGLVGSDHPLLGAAVRLADGSGHVLTGRLSPQTHGWLADHVVADVALVPGAALMEWALRAADEAGCGAVEELALRLPLVMPATGGRCVQVVVGPSADDGRRDIAVYSGPGDGSRSGGDADWRCHAVGVLGPAAPESRAGELPGTWPPPQARPVDTDGFYERIAASGYGYGPAFQGLRTVWRDGADLLAEVALPKAAGEPGGFGIHPALLDAVLHPTLLTGHLGASPGPEADEKRMWLPFTVSGVSLWAAEATAVRVRLTPRPRTAEGERELRVVVADAVGAPVLTIDALVLRPAEAEQLRSANTGHAAAGTGGGGNVRRRAAAAAGTSSADWAARLARLSAVDRYRTLLALVRDHAATVLGHTDAEAVHADANFKELGFESLTAVELRDRLAAATGLRLPAALIFRYPTPEGIAHHLVRRLSSDGTAATPAPTAIHPPSTQLPRQPTDEMSAAQRLESASADQVLEFIDNELGVS
ncbi:acyltransferase domain-containing protein, partial [Streptomyces sp. NPDC044780]|uniref:acyltransferase domain-containing protein n=1 Tax=unclassified Streptomyces TaxID=2593676 RepID=UPI0033F1A20E